MLDRIWRVGFFARRPASGWNPQLTKRSRRKPLLEILEAREMLTASLAPLSNVTVPQQLGFQVPLDGSANPSGVQNYTVSSSNPRIAARIAQGPYWTLNVQHDAAPAEPTDVSFAGSLVFQLFEDLTPLTVSRIIQFTQNGYYNGKNFTRIAPNFPGPTDYVAQGGAPNPDGTGNSGQPGTPFADEFVQQLAFTGRGQLAMANAGPNTNDTQFFVTTGTPTFLDFRHTVFGQLVAGSNILALMTQVATQPNPALGGEDSLPVSPIVINSATITPSHPNGVILIDATSARLGDSATITVTAVDPTDNTSVTEQFQVTIGPYNGPSTPPINFVPFANPVNLSTEANTAANVQLLGQSGFPSPSANVTLTYQLVSQPANGTISQFDPATGTLVYTPNPNFFGIDTFEYRVTSTGPQATPAQTVSIPGTVTVNVGAARTGAVRLINGALVVTPLPRSDRGTDVIRVTQQADSTVPGGQRIVVLVNGIPDVTQPPANSVVQLVVFGTKANTDIFVEPDVKLRATLDGGHGGRNTVRFGGGRTVGHGWFGQTLLVAGPGPNAMVGRRGNVRFKPNSSTFLAFEGVPQPRNQRNRPQPPGGTYYRFAQGRLIPVATI